MRSQKDLIHSSEWDYILLLDACRYDEFEKRYHKFFHGELEKVESEGSQTLEWMYKTFPYEYDISYVSGHPFISSKGITSDCALRRGVEARGGNADYVPAEHFKKIIDVWDWGADNIWSTVTPDEINKALLNNESDIPVIAHYVTPHFPWLIGYYSDDPKKTFDEKVPDIFDDRSLCAKEIFSLGGKEMVKKAYIYNMKIILSEIGKIIPELDGDIIITSDHGNLYEINDHFPMSDNPTLKNVPWFEVERTR